jgi:hypothetical protein
MVQTLNTYAEPGASPDADKLLSFRRYPGGAGELRVMLLKIAKKEAMCYY